MQKWGASFPEAFNELPSPQPTIESKGVRFMAATCRFLSCKSNRPSHKSQTAGRFYGEALFLERGVAGLPPGRAQTPGSQVPASPHPQRTTMTKHGDIGWCWLPGQRDFLSCGGPPASLPCSEDTLPQHRRVVWKPGQITVPDLDLRCFLVTAPGVHHWRCFFKCISPDTILRTSVPESQGKT